MRRPPVLLSGRSPSASVLQGSFWWICVGRFVLRVPLAPPVPAGAASPWRRAPRGCLVPGCLGPLKAAVRLWQRALGCLLPGCLLPGCLLPVKAALAAPWWPSPPDYLLPGLPELLKALASPGRRAPLVCCLAPGLLGPWKGAGAASWRRTAPDCLPTRLLGPWKVAVRSWRRAPSGCGLPGRPVPLKVLVSPWWQPPPDCLAPGRLGALQVAVVAS